MSAEYAYQYYLRRGLSPQAAAGIVGNLAVESGNFAPDVISGKRRGDSGTAWYVQQLRHGRLNNFHKWAKANGLSPTTLDAQLGFVLEELNPKSPYRDAIAAQNRDRILGAPTASEAAKAFMNHYERPNPKLSHFNRRNQVAVNLGRAPGNAADMLVMSAKPAAAAPASEGVVPTGDFIGPVYRDPAVKVINPQAPVQTASIVPEVFPTAPVTLDPVAGSPAVAVPPAQEDGLAGLLSGFATAYNRSRLASARQSEPETTSTIIPTSASAGSRLSTSIPRADHLLASASQNMPNVSAAAMPTKGDILADILGQSGLPGQQQQQRKFYMS